MDLKAIVLDDIRRVTHFARMKERQFATYINQKNSVELRKEMNVLQKELDAMHRWDKELSALFKRLYEGNVLSRITNEQFRMLSSDYNEEQKALAAAIPEKEARLEKLRASAANIESFIEKAKQYTAIDNSHQNCSACSLSELRSVSAARSIAVTPRRRFGSSTATSGRWTARWSREKCNRRSCHRLLGPTGSW